MAKADEHLARRIGEVERGLSDERTFLLGEKFSVADAYLFVVLRWSNSVGPKLDRWPHVVAYMARLAMRSSVRDAMREEGLLKDEGAT